ncbi:MAG TPA: amidohydrolase, partial [Sulfitobacter sp.]|nr:amidohydrolase [Sulfitobacter sp.]
VLPHQVLLRGTVRTLDPAVQDLAEQRLHDLTRLTAEAHQCKAEIDYQR